MGTQVRGWMYACKGGEGKLLRSSETFRRWRGQGNLCLSRVQKRVEPQQDLDSNQGKPLFQTLKWEPDEWYLNM